MSKKLKLIAGAVGAVVLGGLVLFAILTGSGAVTVIAPKSASVKVVANGKTLGSVAAGGHTRFNLDQGDYEVALTASDGTSSQYKLKISNGMFDQILPVGKQCFANFDVTNYVYEKKGLLDALSEEIVVEEKYTEHAPFDVPAGVFFAFKDLPKSIKKGERANVLLETPCQVLDRPDKDVIAASFGE